jgi:transposase, IS5 family
VSRASGIEITAHRHGRIDIRRKIVGNTVLEGRFGPLLDRLILHLASRVRHQESHHCAPKIHSLGAPEASCIGRGKARAPDEFGYKVSMATPISKSSLVCGPPHPC